ncbi:PA2779 family protein [Pseudomonas stutzeri]|nr:PA2779 family protein [Stutzerimonas stutzeri]
MFKSAFSRRLALVLAASQLMLTVQMPVAQASMIGTAEVVQTQPQVERQHLLAMLDDQAVKERLAALGVERDQVERRINSLSNAELAYFNQQLSEAPAGAGAGSVLGIIVLFLVIFIITDMLCATNVFRFVNCINR